MSEKALARIVVVPTVQHGKADRRCPYS